MLIKLAGAPQRLADELNVEEFLEQAQHLQDVTNQSQLSWHSRNRLMKTSSHPLTVERARELDSWVRDGGYSGVLAELAPVKKALPRQSPSRASRRKTTQPAV